MNTRVVALSRQVGTDGEDVARAIAEGLQFRYIDYQVIAAAAHEAGVSEDTVTQAEHTPSVMTRILESLARSPSMPMAGWADPIALTTSPLVTSSDYRRFVEQVILRNRLDTVRVLVTGSPDFRARRIMTGMGVDEKTALKTVERTDNERIEYFRRFYETGWLSPCTYDLTINTDHLNARQAAEVVLTLSSLR